MSFQTASSRKSSASEVDLSRGWARVSPRRFNQSDAMLPGDTSLGTVACRRSRVGRVSFGNSADELMFLRNRHDGLRRRNARVGGVIRARR